MLFPIMMPINTGPPTDYALKMKPVLTAIVIAQGVVGVCRFIVGDIWGGISDLIVVALGYFALTEMSMLYMLWYCIICAFNFFFDLIYVLIRLIELRTAFFDFGQSFLFNMASFVLLAAPALALLGAFVSWRIYKDFRDNAPMPEIQPFAPGPMGYGGPPGAFGPGPGQGGFGYGAAAPAPQRAPGPQFQPFQGSGHRLGGDGFESPPPQQAPQQQQRQQEPLLPVA